MVSAGPREVTLLYHILGRLSVVKVGLPLWRKLDSFCGACATSPVACQRGAFAAGPARLAHCLAGSCRALINGGCAHLGCDTPGDGAGPH
jgi:hypothetical protein